jgi:hypothetical protein
MDINTGSQQDLHYPVARFNEKGCLEVWGWRCSNPSDIIWVKFHQISTYANNISLKQKGSHSTDFKIFFSETSDFYNRFQ